jgi:hypothetical protein
LSSFLIEKLRFRYRNWPDNKGLNRSCNLDHEKEHFFSSRSRKREKML